MDLDGHILLPSRGLGEAAAVEEESAACPCIVLAHLLGDAGTEGEPGEDDLTSQVSTGRGSPIDELREPDVLRVTDPGLGGGERASLVDIGGEHGVPGGSVSIGDRFDAGSLAQCGMEQNEGCHGDLLLSQLNPALPRLKV